MNLPANLFATAFRQQRLGLMFAAIMTILVYLATLALAAQIGLAGMALDWSRNLKGGFTVEIPSSANDNAKDKAEKTEKVIAILQTLPHVERIEPLAEEDEARLLAPWIGDSDVLQSLPLPTLIDVRMKPGAPVPMEDLRNKLAAAVPKVEAGSHADEMSPLQRLIRSLGFLAGLMILLTGVTLIISIVLICRAAMAVQHETLDLLHLIGTVNTDIARQFQRHALRLAWPAAAGGFALALLTAAFVVVLYGHFGQRALTFNPSWIVSGIVMALVPVTAVIVAVATARLSVLSLLRRLS